VAAGRHLRGEDGTTDSHLAAATSGYLQAGAIEYVTTVRPLMPGKYQIGNIGDGL
jgi:hypothetical protein